MKPFSFAQVRKESYMYRLEPNCTINPALRGFLAERPWLREGEGSAPQIISEAKRRSETGRRRSKVLVEAHLTHA